MTASATPTAPQPSASPTPVASSTPSGPADYFGQVIGLDGKPAANVKIRGFVAPGGGASLYRARRLLQTAALETTTDAAGKFKLVDPGGKPLNLEAIQSDTVKAFEFNVSSNAMGVNLQLATAGQIMGVIKVAGATDSSGVVVSIPGTPYTTTTDANGNYTISNVPPGSFTLQGVKIGTGTVNIPNVTVFSNAPASVTEATVVGPAPEITSIAPLNAGSGATVTIKGTNFPVGFNYAVSFQGTPALTIARVDATTLTAVVPAEAASGDVTVKVGEAASNALSFKVVGVLAIAPGTAKRLQVGATQQYTVTAQDSSGSSLADPVVTWSVTGSALEVSSTGLVTAKSPGDATLKVTSGTVTGTLAIKVETPISVSTVAGTGAGGVNNGAAGSSTFEGPSGVAFDPSSGALFVVDNNGNCIRKLQGGNVSTVAGSLTQSTNDGTGDQAGFAFPKHIALNPLRGGFMVADQLNYRIRLVTAAGVVTTIAGGGLPGPAAGSVVNANGTAARFYAPTATAVAPDGSIYVVDQFNHVIRKIATSGDVTTFAGSTEGFVDGAGPAAQFTKPTDIAVGPDGTVYVSDTGNMVIRQITPAGVVTTLAGIPLIGGKGDGDGAVARFNSPDGLALDASGHLYVADLGNHCIRKIDLNTALKTVSTIAGSVRGFADGEDAKFDTPNGLAFDASGDLYVADYGNKRIRKIDLAP